MDEPIQPDLYRSDKVLHAGLPPSPPDSPVAEIAAASLVLPVELTRDPTPLVSAKRALAVPPPMPSDFDLPPTSDLVTTR